MGQRHLFSSSQVFDNEHDPNWSSMPVEQPYIHLARAGVAENGSLLHPVDNMSIDGVHFPPHWNPLPRPNGYSLLQYQPADAMGTPHNLYPHPPASGTFYITPENYAHHPSSSSLERHVFHGVEGNSIDLSAASGSAAYKRKSPGIPGVCERGSTSRYFSAGSSSEVTMTSDLQPEIQATLTVPSYRGNNVSTGVECSLRNVRSRSEIDLETNLARTHLLNNPSYHPYQTSCHIENSGSVDLSGQNLDASALEWNHTRVTPPNYERILFSDGSGPSQEVNHLTGNTATNASLEVGGYHHDFISSRNPVHQNMQGTPSLRAVRDSFTQRSTPTFRGSSSNLRLGHVPTSDEGLHMVAENYSSRNQRPWSTIGWRSSDRNGGRSRVVPERYHRSLSHEAGLRDRMASEGMMIVDRSALYGSRNIFDQHRDMRLDIDEMSYEELLALGDRIGNVNTGLSEDLISNCLKETTYCSSGHLQDEESCVICLEEYIKMDKVGRLHSCGHTYHVGCIKKWLQMKNSCPICKAPAVADK